MDDSLVAIPGETWVSQLSLDQNGWVVWIFCMARCPSCC